MVGPSGARAGGAQGPYLATPRPPLFFRTGVRDFETRAHALPDAGEEPAREPAGRGREHLGHHRGAARTGTPSPRFRALPHPPPLVRPAN